MKYKGRYTAFDPAGIKTYPLAERSNKVTREHLVSPDDVLPGDAGLPPETVVAVRDLAREAVALRGQGRPVVLFTGAHLIKNGLGLLAADLVERGILSLVAGNGATAIHDFELALAGQTSENVPAGLAKGLFGMAYEFAYLNAALAAGDEKELGYGETLGRLICDEEFRRAAMTALPEAGVQMAHPEVSLLAACYRKAVPFTVHAGLGVDVTDQHAGFDGRAKGGCSGRDFLIFVNEITRFTEGGMFLNVGSAVQGPEVLLKAVSMAANAGRAPAGLITADFDLRPHQPDNMVDEDAAGYYYRDQKSVVTRVPQAFGGRGVYVRGNQKQTFPCFYRAVVDLA